MYHDSYPTVAGIEREISRIIEHYKRPKEADSSQDAELLCSALLDYLMNVQFKLNRESFAAAILKGVEQIRSEFRRQAEAEWEAAICEQCHEYPSDAEIEDLFFGQES